MFAMVTQKEQIYKFFYEKKLTSLTSVPPRCIQEIILSSTLSGNSGKMSDYALASAGHRITHKHFLSKGKWDAVQLEEIQKLLGY